jgi:hypothetical protein
MPFTIVILWTDALLWLLVAVVVASGWYIRTRSICGRHGGRCTQPLRDIARWWS